MENRKEIIGATYLFQGEKQAVDSIKLNNPVTFHKGEIIYDENQFRKCIGIVLSGKAKACTLGSDGILSYFVTGSVFGAAALFGENKDYISRIEAVKDCVVQFIEQEALTDIFKKFPGVAVNYISFLSSRVRFLNQRLSIMMRDGAEGKIYAFLVKHKETYGEDYGGKMTGLAASLGIGRTTLYRGIENLENRKLIVRKDGKIKVIL